MAIGAIFHDRVDARAGDAAGISLRQVNADGKILVRGFFRRLAIDLERGGPINPIRPIGYPLSLRHSRENQEAADCERKDVNRATTPPRGTCRWINDGEIGTAHDMARFGMTSPRGQPVFLWITFG
jgi:hypothetical protein